MPRACSGCRARGCISSDSGSESIEAIRSSLTELRFPHATAWSFAQRWVHGLRTQHSQRIERLLTKARPKLARATESWVRVQLREHEDPSRAEETFERLGEKVKAKPCARMAGIIEEGVDVIKESDKGPVLDACLVASAQRAEHYRWPPTGR
ncbi:MAG: DUF892 family protein [Vicinamibacterales bacterium]